jgi:hypothetical protein
VPTLLDNSHHPYGPVHVVAQSSAMLLALILLFLTIPSFSQQRAERTIDEIKTEAIHRAEVGQYPLI